MNPQPPSTTTPAAADTQSVGWIAPTQAGRAEQLLQAHPHLVADNLELRWLLNPALLAHATAQQAAVSGKKNLVAGRPVQTQAMKDAVRDMSKPLTELRGLLKKKFKENYAAYYPQFGLVQTAGDWRLPVDHDVLVENLRDMLLPKLVEHGFDQDPDTGTAVWQPLLDKLDTANTAAAGTDATRAKAVADTTPQDALTEKALRALVHLVQAQFPDTWDGVLRGWGWRKASF